MTGAEIRRHLRPNWLDREFIESALLGATVAALIFFGIRSEDTKSDVSNLQTRVVIVERIVKGGDAQSPQEGSQLPEGSPSLRLALLQKNPKLLASQSVTP